MAKRITMDDVAEVSGISKTTVSYVLNGKNANFHISEATVRKVAETALSLGYYPEKAEAALLRLVSQALSILVLTPWLYAQHSDFMAQLHRAFQQAEAQEPVEFVYMQYHAGSIGKALRPMVFARYDAVFVAGSNDADHAYLTRNAKNLSKVILLNRRAEGILSVSGNDLEASRRLASRVLESGAYRNLIAVTDHDSWCSRFRLEGFRKAVSDGGRELTVLEFSAGTVEDTLRRAAEAAGEQDAVLFTQYYPAALFLTKYGSARGVAAYDTDGLLEGFLPKALTTIDPGLADMAGHAVSLAKQLKQGRSPRSVVVEAKILPGETAALAENHTEIS